MILRERWVGVIMQDHLQATVIVSLLHNTKQSKQIEISFVAKTLAWELVADQYRSQRRCHVPMQISQENLMEDNCKRNSKSTPNWGRLTFRIAIFKWACKCLSVTWNILLVNKCNLQQTLKWENFVVKCFLVSNLAWWTVTTPKPMLYTVLKRHIKHRLWQAVMKWWKKKKKKHSKKRDKTKREQSQEKILDLYKRWYLTFHSAVTLETGHKIAQTHRCVLTYVLAQWHERKCTNSGKGRLRRGVQGSLTFQVEFMRQFGNVKSFGQAHRSKSGRVS